MKKVSLLIAALVFSCISTFAQFSYDFTGCPEGAKVAQTLGLPWTTWSDAPGGSEDGVFGAVDGNMAAYFTYGVDQVVALGEKTTGVYDIEFDIYVEENYMGYFNIMHHHPCNSDQAVQVYLQCVNDGSTGSTTISDGHGTVHAGANSAFDLPCRWNDWMHFRIRVDLDTDVAEFYFDDALMHTWQWSLDSFGQDGYSDRTLGGIDFYPPGNANNSRYYVDNVVFTPLGAEQELIGESFEEYTVGNKIAAEAVAAGHDWWTTWTNNPGGSNDGIVSNDFASEGNNSGMITGNTDQVLLLGGYDTGVYDLEFDMYTPAGKDGYFNMLHLFNGSDSQWAMQAYVNAEADETNSSQWHSTGHGTVFAGGVTADIPAVEDEWMHFRVHIDCDVDEASLYFNETEICTWQWSMESFGNEQQSRTIDGVNFFPAIDNSTSQFYVDNIHFTRIGGESAPHFVITPESVNQELMEDDMNAVAITVSNEGTSIGDWAGWLDFGQGGAGSQSADLYYHNGEESQGIGSDAAYTRELGMRLPATAYAGAAMGMRIVSADYLVGTQYQSADHNYTFRIYGQGLHNQPGELLAEKTINSAAAGTWITATFDEPVYMTGQAMWATVTLEQNAGEYPMSMDGGEYGEEQEGNWLSTNGNSFSHCYSAGNFGGAWLITVHCEGELIPATWATIDKTEGSILGGNSETITLTLNSIGLNMGESYSANLIINTNDAEMAHVEIPVLLAVTDGIEETVAQLASIYPNPASSQVTLNGENLNSVAIYNVAGQLVRIEKLDKVSNTITLDLESGVYFFSVYDNNGRNSVQRVVITK